MLGKFFPGYFGGGVDGGTALVHAYQRQGRGELQGSQKGQGLPSRGTVSHRYGLGGVFMDELQKNLPAFLLLFLGGMGVDHPVFQKFSPGVQSRHFASRAESRVQSEHRLFSQGRAHKNVAKIHRKNPDSLGIRPAFQGLPGLRLQGGFEKPFPGILQGIPHLLRIETGSREKELLQKGESSILGNLD